MEKIFQPIKVGSIELKNRIVMAPLTRMRSKQPGNIPWDLNVEYYQQRASAGLIVTEATQVSQQGQGYAGTPGIHTPAQIEGWKGVTDAVHEKGGKIFLQLWHVGRISHRSHQPDGQLPVAPSAIGAVGKIVGADWSYVDFETPRALTKDEILQIVEDFKQGAQNAKLAGFDGVEVHGANGYLIDQFLQDGTNQREDEYGGSIENRSRFLFQVLDAVLKVWDPSRVGVRLSPYSKFNSMSDSNPLELFTFVIRALNRKNIAYLHLVEPRDPSSYEKDEIKETLENSSHIFRELFQGVYISAGGYRRETALAAVEEGRADAVAFGRWFIANPDLPRRLKENTELNQYDRSTFYGGTEKGYTDYPALPSSNP